MQPTQKPVTDQVAAEDTDPFGDLFFGTADGVDAGSADVWAEIELDRYLSANEARDLAEVGNDGNLPLGYGCSVCGPEEYCLWGAYDGETEDTDGEIEADELPSDSTSTVPVEPVSRILRDAVLYLSRHGWHQHSFYGPSEVRLTPPVCMVGALAMVCYGEPVDPPEEHYDDPGYGDFEAAFAHLDLFVSSRYGVTSSTFNDAKGCNGLQVVGVLLEAADAWDRTDGGAA